MVIGRERKGRGDDVYIGVQRRKRVLLGGLPPRHANHFFPSITRNVEAGCRRGAEEVAGRWQGIIISRSF